MLDTYTEHKKSMDGTVGVLAMTMMMKAQATRDELQVFHPPSPALQKTAAHFGPLL